jgi:uncharacterized protein YebE (UPF0316 family)
MVLHMEAVWLSVVYFGGLFLAKVLDNALGTAKIILIQRNKAFFAGLALGLSNLIYFIITKNIVSSESNVSLIIVSVASAVGCWITVAINKYLSKDQLYVNVVMSDNLEAMKDFRDFLAEHHIKNVASDSYTLDWNTKTITITAYAETKQESSLISSYIKNSPNKFKRLVQK